MNYKRLFVSNSIVFITFVTGKRREILQSNIGILRQSFIEAKNKYGFKIIAICVLKNHVHMLIKPANINEYPLIIKEIKIYFSKNICKDTIIRETSGEDVILLSETRNSNNVVFYQNDNNLVINYGIVHDDGTIIVEDYFLNNGYKIEKIQLSNNEYLESSEIDSIIQNMNAYAAENGIQISSANDITNNDELMQLVTSGWQS